MGLNWYPWGFQQTVEDLISKNYIDVVIDIIVRYDDFSWMKRLSDELARQCRENCRSKIRREPVKHFLCRTISCAYPGCKDYMGGLENERLPLLLTHASNIEIEN